MILGKCRFCSAPLTQPVKGRNRTFCDEECKAGWRKEQREVARDERDEREREVAG